MGNPRLHPSGAPSVIGLLDGEIAHPLQVVGAFRGMMAARLEAFRWRGAQGNAAVARRCVVRRQTASGWRPAGRTCRRGGQWSGEARGDRTGEGDRGRGEVEMSWSGSSSCWEGRGYFSWTCSAASISPCCSCGSRRGGGRVRCRHKCGGDGDKEVTPPSGLCRVRFSTGSIAPSYLPSPQLSRSSRQGEPGAGLRRDQGKSWRQQSPPG